MIQKSRTITSKLQNNSKLWVNWVIMLTSQCIFKTMAQYLDITFLARNNFEIQQVLTFFKIHQPHVSMMLASYNKLLNFLWTMKEICIQVLQQSSNFPTMPNLERV